MPPQRNSKGSASQLKQAKLSFTSKRNSSTAAAAAGKKSKPGKSSSGHGSRASPDDKPIDISDSDDEVSAIPAAKKRRVGSLRVRNNEPEPEPELEQEPEKEKEREPLNVSDKRWRKVYGAAREKMGNIEPVHAQGQSMVNHILRVFDLSYEYGPCVGVSRLDRWERAHALGLDPPLEVKEILLTKEGHSEERYAQSVFYGEV
ncbi:DNA polymerase delta, subunit 4-domain-containing protein [Cubamyces lactineus]|nr:DNA polymerase delta, subunit 4-domain-containing protein [Cubamyces lactineus]